MPFGGAPTAIQYGIANAGSVDLTFTGAQPVTIVGPDAADFSVSMQPPSPITPLSLEALEIQFSPTSATFGLRQATVQVASNDRDEPVFSFDVAGIVASGLGEIDVQGGLAVSIVDGSNAISVLDGTDFGSVALICLLYTSPSPRDATLSRMPSSA